MTNIDEIMARLSKDTLSKFRMGNEISLDYIPSPSIGLNMQIGGGFGIGKQTTIWGNESAGKSAIMLQTAAIAQKQDRGVAYFDVEKTFNKNWAARLGVDVPAMPISQVSSIGDYTDAANDAIKAGMELIIVDSTSALMPKSFFDDGELKNFDKTGQIGQFAREIGQAGRMIQGTNFTCAIVHISQVRMDLSNSFMASQKASGGKEVGHADSLRVRIFSSRSEKQAIMGERNGIQEMVGRKVTWTIDKNKMNGRYGTGEYDLYTQGDFVGVDAAGELLDYGIKFGILEKGGAWITVFDERFQGRPKAVDYIRNNQEIADKILKDINDKSLR